MADAHPHAMAPAKPGKTRTAPPQRPPQFPSQGRYRAYTLFGWTGLIYLLLGVLAIEAVWALGDGAAAWDEQLARYQHPLYIAFHVLALVSVIFVGMRFFRLFPKAQPPRIGPAKPPPAAILTAMLYSLWIGISLLMTWVLAGGVF